MEKLLEPRRTPSSSRRASFAKMPGPKSSNAVKRPLLTRTALFVRVDARCQGSSISPTLCFDLFVHSGKLLDCVFDRSKPVVPKTHSPCLLARPLGVDHLPGGDVEKHHIH